MKTTLTELLKLASKRPFEIGRFYYPENGTPGECEITQVGELGILAKVCLPVAGRSGHEEGKANAALLAHAANCVEELVEALRLQIKISENVADQQAMPDDSWLNITEKNRAVLAKSETVEF